MTFVTETLPAEASPRAQPGLFASALAAESHHALTLRLTLIMVVLHGATSPFLSVVVRVVGVLMLIAPQLLIRARGAWWLLAGSLVASNLDQWWAIDNHQYLITYWVLACALTMTRPQDLRVNARLLVGIAFGFAVAWKAGAGEYFNGSFFYYTFLTDPRVQNVAGLIVDGGHELVKQTSEAISMLGRYGDAGDGITIVRDARLHAAAVALSVTGLVIETLVAVLHLMPERRAYLARHLSLMVFVAFTYLLLPVTGFAFLLGVMGFAQVDEEDQRLRQVYIVLLCFIQITLVPWRNLLVSPPV